MVSVFLCFPYTVMQPQKFNVKDIYLDTALMLDAMDAALS